MKLNENLKKEQIELIDNQIVNARDFYSRLLKTKGGYEKIIKKFNINNKNNEKIIYFCFILNIKKDLFINIIYWPNQLQPLQLHLQHLLQMELGLFYFHEDLQLNLLEPLLLLISFHQLFDI